MKKLLLLMGLAIGFVSCSDDSDSPVENENPEGNNVALLKVDFETNAFEGGKILSFEGAEDLTISTIYHSPGDFGDITLMYEEVNDTIFSGGIVWAGTGQITYPEVINGADSFQTVTDGATMPALQYFQIVQYDEFQYTPETINYASVWDAIDNLQVVKSYRNTNPNGKVHLLLYTPSVGVGNPAEWDWIVMLGNNPGDIMPN